MPVQLIRHKPCSPEIREHRVPQPSAAARGYGYRWQKLAHRFLAEHPLCADPFKRHGEQFVAAREVDHIVPRRSGGTDLDTNLQALCSSCHAIKTVRFDGGFGRYRTG